MSNRNVSVLRPGIAQTHRTEAIKDDRKPSTRNKASYGHDVQIAELNAHILRCLHKIANHVQAKRFDQAGIACELVVKDRARLAGLMVELAAMPVDPEPAPVLTKPKTHVVRKRKVYKQWASK